MARPNVHSLPFWPVEAEGVARLIFARGETGRGRILCLRDAAIATTGSAAARTGFAGPSTAAGSGVPAPRGRRPWCVVFDFDHLSRHIYRRETDRAHVVCGPTARIYADAVVPAGFIQ